MYAAIITLLAASSAIAAPLAIVERAAPNHYAEGYLESYDTYHARYLAIGCSGQQGTDFFQNCCRPLLATQSVEADRPAYCAAGSSASSSAPQSSASPVSASAPAYSASTSASAPGHAGVAAAVVVPSSSASPSPAKTSAAAPSSSPSPSSGGQSGGYQYQGGFATYFYQEGHAGACGQVHSDSDLGIAIDGNGFWQNYGQVSQYCGQKINIKNTNNGKTVTATVWDVCPTCTNNNSLDLSVGAFNAIADPSDGMVPIEWSFA